MATENVIGTPLTPTVAAFHVKEITGTDVVASTYALRYRVWSACAHLADSVEAKGYISDEHDDHARHWAAFSESGILLASARLCVHQQQEDVPESYCYRDLDLPGMVASINRLVVDQCVRKLGIAQELDVKRIAAAKEACASCIVVAPTSPGRINALEKLGFTLTSQRCECSYKKDFWLSVMLLMLRKI